MVRLNKSADRRRRLEALLRTYGAHRVPCLKRVWVDGGYRGNALQAWVAQLKRTHKIALEVVKKTGHRIYPTQTPMGDRTNLCLVVQLSNPFQRLSGLAG